MPNQYTGPGDVKARILASVEQIPFSSCWIWMKGLSSKGYGTIWVDGTQFAHRVSYEVFKGAIPENLQIDHMCGVKCCVNPDHLKAVTAKKNCQLRYHNRGFLQ